MTQKEWTKLPPSVPGWYWHSATPYGTHDGPYAVLVEQNGMQLFGWVPMMDYISPVDSQDGDWPGLWHGPIDPPQMPDR